MQQPNVTTRPESQPKERYGTDAARQVARQVTPMTAEDDVSVSSDAAFKEGQDSRPSPFILAGENVLSKGHSNVSDHNLENAEWGTTGKPEIDDGWHEAVIAKYEDESTKFGDCWRFVFKTLAGVEISKLISKPTGAGVIRTSNLYKLYAAVETESKDEELSRLTTYLNEWGNPIAKALQVLAPLDKWIGEPVRIFVENDDEDPDGWPRVTKFGPTRRTDDEQDGEF